MSRNNSLFVRLGVVMVAVLWLAGIAEAQRIGRAVQRGRLEAPGGQFPLTAGNAWFVESPGGVCEFDFGDPHGAYNVLTGFNAAHVYDTPGTYTVTLHRNGQPDQTQTVTVVPDNRPNLVVDAKADLLQALRGLRANTLVLLPAGATFEIPATIDVKGRNISFRAAGQGPPPRVVHVTPAGGKTGSPSFNVAAPNVTFSGIEFDSDKPLEQFKGKIRYRAIVVFAADCFIDRCVFRNVDDAIMCSATTRGVLARWSKFTHEIRGYSLYCMGADAVMLGCTMETSQEEHNVRASEPGFHNLLLVENDFTNLDGKESLTFRHGENLYAARNAFHRGWIRFGPGPRGDHRPLTPEELAEKHVSHVVFDSNQIEDRSYITVNEGADDVTVCNNNILVDREHVGVFVAGPSLHQIRFQNNKRILVEGQTPKPFLRHDAIAPEDLTEEGTQTLERPRSRTKPPSP